MRRTGLLNRVFLQAAVYGAGETKAFRLAARTSSQKLIPIALDGEAAGGGPFAARRSAPSSAPSARSVAISSRAASATMRYPHGAARQKGRPVVPLGINNSTADRVRLRGLGAAVPRRKNKARTIPGARDWLWLRSPGAGRLASAGGLFTQIPYCCTYIHPPCPSVLARSASPLHSTTVSY